MKSALFGSTLGFAPLIAAKLKKVEQPDILEKVTSAMLSMQRASWEHGVAAQAMLETGNDKMVYLMAKEAVLRQLEDGRFSVVYSDNGNTDPGCVGEAVLRAYQRYGDDELKTGIDKMLKYFLNKAPRAEDGTLFHTLDSPEIWSDSFFMCPPFLTACGKYKEALAQIDGIRKVLWNQYHKLFSHRWHCVDKKFINHRFWGGGNGWAAASFCRILKMLPEEMKSEKNRLAGYLQELLDGCLPNMRKDGLFHDYINEPETFVETNLAQMLAYSIFRAVKGGWLPESYLKSAEKMRTAAYAQIDENGYVTGVCGAPYFETPGRSTEGQAFFYSWKPPIGI
ncbi:MAG: glycoside hydrolase family 88 protein [Candidatus Marinimicrobia bacterium]|nr:glycoside hydrolase family 88 protein [Candidatus Neomarinimicrobiota bacterium]